MTQNDYLMIVGGGGLIVYLATQNRVLTVAAMATIAGVCYVGATGGFDFLSGWLAWF